MHREEARLDLAEQVRRLEASRQQHIAALAQIDQLLSRIGDAVRTLDVTRARGGRQSEQVSDSGHEGVTASPEALTRNGRRPRRYHKAELTGEQAVLAFVHRQGSATTAEINRQWRIEGRGGLANNAILQLLRRGELVREPIPDRRGSRYRSPARPDLLSSTPVVTEARVDPPPVPVA